MKSGLNKFVVCMGLLAFTSLGCESASEPFVEENTESGEEAAEAGDESAEEGGESGEEGGESSRAATPCADLNCGDTCFLSTCEGIEADEDCAAIALPGWCDQSGACVEMEPECAASGCEGVVCTDETLGAPAPYCEDGKILMPADPACNPATGFCEDQEPKILEDCAEQGLMCQIVDEIGECVKEDLCADFIPPCSEDADCPGEMTCSFDGCNPSTASCDPETGEVMATADCGGGICIDNEENPCALVDCFEGQSCEVIEGEAVCVGDFCADFIPPCSVNADCPGDMVCSFEGCNPSEASCDPETGLIASTDDCSGGQCVESTLCEGILCESGYSCDSQSGECVFDPCQGLECGAPCDTCEPGTDCPLIEMMTFCQADGSCSEAEPQCKVEKECTQEECGEPEFGFEQNVCWDGSQSGIVCEADEAGVCGWVQVNCPMDPCSLVDCEDTATCEVIEGEAVCVGGFCDDFIPPCEQDSDCPGEMVCSFEGCNSSGVFCDEATGEIISTPDCGGGVCKEPYDPCAGKECGDFCVPCDPEGPEDCAMEGMACNADGKCMENVDSAQECGIDLCADFIPPCSENADCPGSMMCSFNGCNPSEASCNSTTGVISLTDDCGGGVCVDSCAPGTTIPAGDGCNTCECPESGVLSEAIACTKKGCTEKQCQSSANCGPNEFCDFPYDNCGNGGSAGTCAKRPEVCPEIGSVAGECGCDGNTYNSSCEAQAAGTDLQVSGGCESWDNANPGFHCADIICGLEQGCSIAANDVVGPDQPEAYVNCFDITGDGIQGKCFTFGLDAWTTCFDAGGYVIIFYPGG